MKKHIIFTGVMAAILLSAGAANAATLSVASQSYVDAKVKTNTDALTTLDGRVTTAERTIEIHASDISTNAGDIDKLEGLVGETAVATQISDAIAEENLSQYATDADLSDAKTAIKNTTDALGTRVTANEGAITELQKLSGTGEGSVSAQISALDQAYKDADAVLQDEINANEAAITKLNGDASTAGSVAKAIADLNINQYATDLELSALNTTVEGHTTSINKLDGAADVDGSVKQQIAASASTTEIAYKAYADQAEADANSATDTKLEAYTKTADLNTTFATDGELSAAIAQEVTDRNSAIATESTVLKDGVIKTNADAIDALEVLVGDTAVATQIDNKITALNLANTYDAKGAAATAESNAKAYADGLAGNYDAKGSAAQALTDAKAYTDAEITELNINQYALDTDVTAVNNKFDGTYKFDSFTTCMAQPGVTACVWGRDTSGYAWIGITPDSTPDEGTN